MQAAADLGSRELFGRSSVAWRQTIFGVEPKRTLARVLCWWLLCSVLFQHCLLPVKIIGSSMAPTYSNGSLNVINRLSYRAGAPIRGDVVALESSDEVLLKRIVAVPGEKVAIEYGVIYINDKPLTDEFSAHRVPWEVEATTLQANEYFVIGDNRETSVFGAVAREKILGRIMF